MAINEITSALWSIKKAKDATKEIVASEVSHFVKDNSHKINEHMLDLYENLAEIREMFDGLQRQNDELKEELAAAVNWEDEKKNYCLEELAPCVYIYVYRPSGNGSDREPDHMLCANCFNKNRKSILQLTNSGIYSGDYYVCHHCKVEFRDYSKAVPIPIQQNPYIV